MFKFFIYISFLNKKKETDREMHTKEEEEDIDINFKYDHIMLNIIRDVIIFYDRYPVLYLIMKSTF